MTLPGAPRTLRVAVQGSPARPVKRVPRRLLMVALALAIVGVLGVVFARGGVVPRGGSGAAPGGVTVRSAVSSGTSLAAGRRSGGSATVLVPETVLPAFGASRLGPAGVPLGYAHSLLGAVAAATNFVIALRGNVAMLTPLGRAQVIGAVAGPGVGPSLLASMAPILDAAGSALGAVDGVVPAGDPVAYRVIPFGWRLHAYDQGSATVLVWYESWSGVASDSSPVPVQASYWTEAVSLVWSGGDWKWSGFSAVSGPAPLADSSTGSESSAGDLASALLSFHTYSYGGL